MFIGGTVTAGFAAVKTAFEENYACMGFTCGDVGGLMLNDGYYAGFSPCVDASTPSSSGSSDGDDKNWAVPVVVVLSVVVVALLGVSIGLYVGKQPANQPAGLLQATPVNAVPMDDTQQTGASVHSGTNKVEMDTDPAGQMEPTEDTAAQADSVMKKTEPQPATEAPRSSSRCFRARPPSVKKETNGRVVGQYCAKESCECDNVCASSSF